MPEAMLDDLLKLARKHPMNEMIYNKHPHERLRILVVEDSEMQKLIFLKALPGIHTIRMASDAKEGWTFYLETAPHIVFLDIGLPDGSGNDLARLIKEHNQTTHIIMATANSDRENKEKAVHNRVDGFIVKPISAKEINDHIERFMALRRRDMAHRS